MEEYRKRHIFFIEGKNVYSYSKALKVDYLQEPITQLDDFILRRSKRTPLMEHELIKSK